MNFTIHNTPVSHSKMWAAGGIAVGLAAGLAAGLFVADGGGSSDVQLHKAVTLSISPLAFDCRARLVADINDTANHTQQPEDKLAKSKFGHIIGLNKAEDMIAKTFNTSVNFSGDVDSISCIPTTAETIENSPDGSQTISVDLSKVKFITYEDENASHLYGPNNGVMADVGSAEWSLFNNPVKTRIQNEEGTLDQAAVEEAINETQASCDPNAWSVERGVFEASMLSIAEQQLVSQYPDIAAQINSEDPNTVQQGRAAIALKASSLLHFVYTGTPQFAPVYQLPKGYSVQKDKNLQCGVASNVINPVYVDPTTHEPANLTTGN
jgi:hypothetical protein